jgi:hypothetical protein
MQYSIPLGPRVIHVAAQTIQRLHAHPHARTLNTVGPRVAPDPDRPTTEQADSVGLSHKKSPDRNVLYLGGGLAVIGPVWYYYETMEDACIGDVEIHKAGVESANRGRASMMRQRGSRRRLYMVEIRNIRT